jgi:hypothetical protein
MVTLLQTTGLDELNEMLPTLEATVVTTVVLEAGRRALDAGKAVSITCVDGVYGIAVDA